MSCAKIQMEVEPSALEIKVKMKVSDLGRLLGVEADGGLLMRVTLAKTGEEVEFSFVEVEERVGVTEKGRAALQRYREEMIKREGGGQ